MAGNSGGAWTRALGWVAWGLLRGYCFGAALLVGARGLLWGCSGVGLRLLWVVPGLLWSCLGAALGLPWLGPGLLWVALGLLGLPTFASKRPQSNPEAKVRPRTVKQHRWDKHVLTWQDSQPLGRAGFSHKASSEHVAQRSCAPTSSKLEVPLPNGLRHPFDPLQAPSRTSLARHIRILSVTVLGMAPFFGTGLTLCKWAFQQRTSLLPHVPKRIAQTFA